MFAIHFLLSLYLFSVHYLCTYITHSKSEKASKSISVPKKCIYIYIFGPLDNFNLKIVLLCKLFSKSKLPSKNVFKAFLDGNLVYIIFILLIFISIIYLHLF